MLRQVLPCGVKVKYVEPNDCAISKYARSEPKDREWIRACIETGILSLPTIEYRLRETRFRQCRPKRYLLLTSSTPMKVMALRSRTTASRLTRSLSRF